MSGDPKTIHQLATKALLDRLALLLIPVLTASAPLAIFSASDWFSGTAASVASGSESGAPEPQSQEPSAPTPSGQALAPARDDPPVLGIADVFRFDITTDWIVARWPRVSAGLALLELQGYRVPLITGTREDDLAGALTYYFSPQQRLQRITFQGTTGNANKLVHLLTTRFGFTHRPTNDPSLFLYVVPEVGSKGQVKSFVWIRPVRVVSIAQPHQRFEVALVIERPES